MRDAIDVEMSGILGNIPRSVKSQEILDKKSGKFPISGKSGKRRNL